MVQESGIQLDPVRIGVLGWLRYPEQEGYMQTCMLYQETDGFKVLVPFEKEKGPVSQWFLPKGAQGHAGMPEDTLPDVLWIEEIGGDRTFSLVGCRIIGISSNLFSGVSTGTILADYVVLGNRGIDYSRVNGARTSYPELFEWVGLASLVTKHETHPEDASRLVRFSVEWGDIKQVIIPTLDGVMKLYSNPTSTQTYDETPTVVMRSGTVFETSYEKDVPIEGVLEDHLFLMNILCILSWSNIGLRDISVARADDLERVLPEQEAAPRYHDVLTLQYGWQEDRPTKKRPRYLCYFDDVGPEGLGKLYSMRSEIFTAIGQLSFVAKQGEHLTLQTYITTFAMAFEEICEFVCSERGVEPPHSIKGKIALIVGEVMEAYRGFPLVEPELLCEDIAETYNAIKHTRKERKGRPREDWLKPEWLFDISLACRIVSQSWLVCRMGCVQYRVIDYLKYNYPAARIGRWFCL